MTSRNREAIVSGGNIFEDLGLPEPEGALAKADLAIEIRHLAKNRHLTQAETAALLGTTQPKISDIFSGRLAGFSLERLIRYMILMDRDVTLVISEKPTSAARATFRVRHVDASRGDVAMSYLEQKPGLR